VLTETNNFIIFCKLR